MDNLYRSFVLAQAFGGGSGGGGGGGTAVVENDVNFIDYDGAIRYSYSAADFAGLSALPGNPTHEGLTPQGWNWTLADAQAYVASYGFLDIGQMYITDDGKTRVYIHLDEGRLSPYFGVCIKGTATINWGDGSEDTTITKSMSSPTRVDTKHTFPSAGDYVITVTPPTGTNVMSFDGNNSYGTRVLWNNKNDSGGINRYYQAAIKKVELGSGFTFLDTACFYFAQGLKSITIPNTITRFGGRAFCYCSMLPFVTMPSSLSTLGGSAFNSSGLTMGAFPPPSVSELLETSYFASTQVKKASTALNGTGTGNQFVQDCLQLREFVITSNITELWFKFLTRSYITRLVIPDTVTTLTSSSLDSLISCGIIKFNSSAPPTASSSDVFQSLPKDCEIYVPAGSLSAYTSATNYPSSSTYTYVEY